MPSCFSLVHSSAGMADRRQAFVSEVVGPSLVFLSSRQMYPVRPEPRLAGQVREGLRYAPGRC